ncbi:MAG: fused response regulator/phosphatase [Actinomycetota bacterium]
MDSQRSVPNPRLPEGGPARGSYDRPRHPILLVEDDPGDAAIVKELLSDSGDEFPITWAKSIAEARRAVTPETMCCLVDLGLPDAQGLEAVRAAVELAPHAAVIVLTGLVDWAKGTEAVAKGAHNYLIKGAVDEIHLAWSIRFAIERKRAEEANQRRHEAEFRRAETMRLERGLLPNLLVKDRSLHLETRYRPGGARPIIGGDFLDAVELEDGTVRLILGDVSGHGPDQAAVGVGLRIAWRTLVLAGHPEDTTLTTLDRILRAERPNDSMFATACELTIEPNHSRGWLRVAGHPNPISLLPEPTALAVPESGPPLGVVDGPSVWEPCPIRLRAPWALLLITDGLLEGRPGDRERSLGHSGLVELAAKVWPRCDNPGQFADELIEQAETDQGGALPDDVALVLMSSRGPADRDQL